MTPENELKLSFYQDVSVLNHAHDIRMVKHVETGTYYVRKTMTHFDPRVIEVLTNNVYNGIPRIQETIEDGDKLIVIEEYIRGDSLDKVLEKLSFTASEAASVIMRLCGILTPLHAHDPSIIHRDIKASNIILAEGGALYLIDFDAAKLHDPGKNRDTVLIGTEEYAAPEQYGFGQSDCQTDIYALGVLLNILLTGHVPTDGLAEGPLADIISRCTQMDPKNRYQTVTELETSLRGAAEQLKADLSSASTADELPFYRRITGFKSGKKVAAIATTLWFILFTYGCITAESFDKNGRRITGFLAWSNNLAVWLVLLLETLYLGNSFGWRDRFPYRKKPASTKVSNAFRVLLGAVIILFALAFLSTIIDLIYQAVAG